MSNPFACVFKGGAFHPLRRHHNEIASRYGEGEIVFVEEVEERSPKSHKHEFAWLKEAWLNLPERIADDFPTPEHLRKRALILGGFYHETIIDAGTNAAALRVAAYARNKDGFSHVVVRGPLVVERTAKSQSRRAMRAEEFQASKQAVLDVVSAMIGVAPEALRKAEAA
jgi:hypothetical protein